MTESFSKNEFSSDNFNASNVDTKYIVPRLIRLLVREVNKNKIDHGTLKYIYRQVREKCELVVHRKPKKLYELPTDEEIKKFFSVIDDPTHHLLFEVLAGTGMREAELCSLQVSKIDFTKNSAHITGKGSKDRLILFSDRLKNKIQLFLSNRNHRYLFESNRGSRYSTRRIQQICAHYKFRAGIQRNLTPHTFRHLLATKLAESGVSVESRKIIFGHSSSRSQEIYTHLGIAGVAPDILQKLDMLGL